MVGPCSVAGFGGDNKMPCLEVMVVVVAFSLR